MLKTCYRCKQEEDSDFESDVFSCDLYFEPITLCMECRIKLKEWLEELKDE